MAKLKVYLSAPISGEPQGEVLKLFDDAEQFVISSGFECINPLRLQFKK